jgi:hypothetical protein
MGLRFSGYYVCPTCHANLAGFTDGAQEIVGCVPCKSEWIRVVGDDFSSSFSCELGHDAPPPDDRTPVAWEPGQWEMSDLILHLALEA